MEPKIHQLKIAQQFIGSLKNAILDDSTLDDWVCERLRNSPTSTVDDMLDPIPRLSIDIYLAVGNASQETYNSVRNALMRYNPAEPLLSYDIVKRHITRAKSLQTTWSCFYQLMGPSSIKANTLIARSIFGSFWIMLPICATRKSTSYLAVSSEAWTTQKTWTPLCFLVCIISLLFRRKGYIFGIEKEKRFSPPTLSLPLALPMGLAWLIWMVL